ncbi:hypothetical protein ABT341_17175, partial [Pseudonocardia alni]
MADRSRRPHHSLRATPAPVVRRIVHLRWKKRLGPVQIADRVGIAPSTEPLWVRWRLLVLETRMESCRQNELRASPRRG